MSSKKTKNNEAPKVRPGKMLGPKPKRSRLGSASIAFQISVEQISGLFLLGLLGDCVYVLLYVLAVVYNATIEVNGSLATFGKTKLLFEGGSTFREYVSSAVIAVEKLEGGVQNVPAGSFAIFLAVSLAVTIAIQFLILLASCLLIPDRTYKRLAPLANITEAAQELKNFDITDSGSTDGDFEIHTGKEELAGLEDAVNDLLRRSRDSYQSQIRFVSDASHELRTPIAVIQGYANMLDRWGREDKDILDESIDSIKSEAENMNRLVENLLFLARGDSGRAVIRFEELNVNALICDIYNEFVMIDKKHEFRLDLRSDVTAHADPSLLKQCLRILIDNAVKYSPEGTDIILRLQERDSGHFSIDVQDYGIGIKPDEIDKIFERFYRSDPARNRRSGGYGLGLSIAKWIADKHSGFFEVLSYENLGTRISLILPYSTAESGDTASSGSEVHIENEPKDEQE